MSIKTDHHMGERKGNTGASDGNQKEPSLSKLSVALFSLPKNGSPRHPSLFLSLTMSTKSMPSLLTIFFLPIPHSPFLFCLPLLYFFSNSGSLSSKKIKLDPPLFSTENLLILKVEKPFLFSSWEVFTSWFLLSSPTWFYAGFSAEVRGCKAQGKKRKDGVFVGALKLC